MAIQDTRDPPHRGRRHVHRRRARPGRRAARPGRRRRPHRLELHAGLLGADDHARDPRRARGLHAGRGRGRRARRRDRDPHQGHRGHLARDRRPATTRRWRGASTATRTARRSARAAASSGRETRVEGIGETAVRCVALRRGRDARSRSPTATRSRSTGGSGVTVDKARAEEIARDAARYAALPDNSVQNPILTFAPSDIVGLVTRMRPFLGQLRHDAVGHDAGLPQRGRLRRVPGRRAAQVRDGRARRCSSTRPTATWTSTPSAPARSSSAR